MKESEYRKTDVTEPISSGRELIIAVDLGTTTIAMQLMDCR